MHLVVNNEAPVVGVQQREVSVFVLAFGSQNLVSRDCDRLYLFERSGVFANFIFGEGGAAQQLSFPLASRHGVGHQD